MGEIDRIVVVRSATLRALSGRSRFSLSHPATVSGHNPSRNQINAHISSGNGDRFNA